MSLDEGLFIRDMKLFDIYKVFFDFNVYKFSFRGERNKFLEMKMVFYDGNI